MKKLLSMLLAITLVMSLFCAVPVSAEEFTMPYVNSDFNDIADGATTDYSDDFGVWLSAKSSIEGVAGGKALYKESTSVTSGGAYIQYKLNGSTPAVMASGEQYKISFWLKLNTEKTRFADVSNPSTLHLCYTANGGAKGYKSYNFSAQTEALNTGEWVYYEQTFAGWNGVHSNGYDTVANTDGAELVMHFRLGNVNGTGPSNVLAEGYNATYAIAIDDFRIESIRTPYDPGNVVEEAYVPKTVLSYSFDNAGTTGHGVNTWSVNNDNAGKSVVTGGGADGGNYAKIEKTTTQTVAGKIYDYTWTSYTELDSNKLTKITFWAKALDANTNGAEMRLRLYQKMHNTSRPSALDTVNVNKSDLFPDGCWYINVGNMTTSWKQYTVYFKNNAKTFDESAYRIALQVKNANAGVCFGIDNMVITQEEIPTNGEFENLGYAPAQTVKSDGTVLANEQSKNYVTNMYGWLAEGATVTADTATKHGGSQAAKVVTTEEGGSPYQGIYLVNNKTHEISFWAKGEGDSIGKNISVVLDRAVATKSQYDIYSIEDTVTLTPSDAVLTENWKKYTVNYTLNSTIPEGTEMPTINSNQVIGVRQPLLKFSVDGGAAGMTYYLDDLKIKEPAAGHPYPYVTDYNMYEKDEITVATPVDDKPVCVKYVPVSEVSGDAVKAVVTRVMLESKAGSDKYGTYQAFVDATNDGKVSFKIPKNCVGRKIKISIQPFSENGAIGAHYEKVIGTIAKQYEATMTVGNYVSETSSITTTYSITNNKVDDSDVRAIIAAIFYADNGEMVKCVTNPVVVENGTSVANVTFTATSTLTDLSLPAATKAKVYFWFAEGEDSPSVFNTTMEEVLASVEVPLS